MAIDVHQQRRPGYAVRPRVVPVRAVVWSAAVVFCLAVWSVVAFAIYTVV